MKDLDATLNDAELKELDELLADPALEETAMDLSTLEGFLTAVVIGPSIVMPSLWIPWVWDMHEGKRDPEFEDMEAANHILGLVMRLYNGLNQQLRDAPEDFEPVFWRGAEWGAAEWCEGFLLGMRFHEKAWALLRNAKPEWFETCIRLGTEAVEEPLDEGEAERWMNDIAPSVVKIKAFWDFWQEQTQSPAPGGAIDAQGAMPGGHSPVVHKGSKIGRNDPCPCGSGKKYKKCCGAPWH